MKFVFDVKNNNTTQNFLQFIILNKEIHKNIIKKIIESFSKINYYLNGLTFSPIKGGNGNIEYLAYFTKTKVNNIVNINKLVEDTFNKLK